MQFETLLIEADALGVPVVEKPFKTYDGRIKNNKIYLRQNMSQTEKTCVLAEELGHHYTTVGNILDQQDTGNVKQERRARLWSYDRCVGLSGIVSSFNAGCHSLNEMAEHLNVTEEFLVDALEAYRSKYGTHTQIDNYIIFFEPISVMRMYE